MGMDDQENQPVASAQEERHARRRLPRSGAFKLAALALTAVSLSAMGFLMLGLLHAPVPPSGTGPAGSALASARLFSQWPRDRDPDLVLQLTGQQHGFLKFCGCSEPQYGGLERRYNFMQALIKERHWPIMSVDLGDIAQRPSPQALLKYKFSMDALHRLGYTAVGIGQNEMDLPLLDGLAQYSLDNPSPRVLAANLADKQANFPDMVADCAIGGSKGRQPRVAVVGVVADSVAKVAQRKDPSLHFDPVDKVLPAVLANRKLQEKKPELYVLLYQGSPEEARACAAKFPQFRVILCLTKEEEPSGEADKVGDTLIVGVGHKGRYIGLVGIYRTDAGFDLSYQLVQMGPEYETPQEQQAGHPILSLLEEYAREVKKGNFLAQYPVTLHPVQRAFKGATYVGSQKCKECHEHAYEVWQDTPHAHAYATLVVKAKKPSLRQYDGECVVCHVTGFGFSSGFTDEASTPKLENNGCENCHGPGSLHVKRNRDPALMALMNPYKTQPGETPTQRAHRINRLDESCQKCHDIDNDVTWTKVPFEEKWKKIVHMTPASEK